ncbi:biliverdin-producing heme oxygenase [Mangrovicella endophytica]|uniref:biliverdin-producing heme oxygenase n=1 Tax=Mangrovicella endophytica TaxID=2066697 RepID=UPI000C9E1394|nr:biliverdin-producing heme oxygenase [Mangrovicella endophytica]
MTETVAPETPVAAEPSRTKRLKALTHATHERLDQSIMAGKPFAERRRYGLFLQVQQQFHRDIEALYADPELDGLLPNLADRSRLRAIEQDLADLGVPTPAKAAAPAFAAGHIDLPTALGWLYVAEGSNLGAAFLLKAAAALGLSEEFGARHLAAAPEGRGLNWRTFTAALDGLALSPAEEERVTAGATAAFRRVQGLVDTIFGPSADTRAA